MEIIARIKNDYSSKFGVPRQANLVDIESTIIFEEKYRVPEALRELDKYDYIWLIWGFSENENKPWSPTVRPPRLGGNKRVGVFASRSPFRPNSLGLSSVKLKAIEKTEKYGYVLKISGADLMDGTPIYDIKPYLPYVDSHPEASNGFALSDNSPVLKVIVPDSINIADDKLEAIIKVLEQDPRPQYIEDEEREYGLTFGGYNIKFKVKENELKITEAIEI